MYERRHELDGVTDVKELQTPENMQESALKHFNPAFLAKPGPGLIQMAGTTAQYPSTIDGMRGQAAALLGHDTLDRLGEVRVPTLVLHGADDTMVDARNAPLLAEGIPGAELHMFAGLRHGFTAERPDLVNDALLQFLARHSTAAAA